MRSNNLCFAKTFAVAALLQLPLLASLIIPGLQHGVKKGRHVGFIFTVILTMKGHFC